MKARNTLIPAVCLAVLALAVAGCSKGGGGSSGGSGSSSKSSSGGAGGGGAAAPAPDAGGGTTAKASPPSPDLGYAYHTAALAYYYFYHKKSTIIWGDVGAYWGHYDQEDYSAPLEMGYSGTWPSLQNATVFGSYYDYYTPPPAPAPGIPPHDPGFDGPAVTRADIQADALAAYTALGSTVTYPADATYTGTGPDAYGQYVYDLAGSTFTTGVYHFNSNARLKGTLASPGVLTISGSATDIFVFRIEGNLYVEGSTKVVFTGGAKAENVYWRVGVEAPYGYYVGYDSTTGRYIYADIPGAMIGDDQSYPPYNDPKVNGASSFAGTILCNGDVAIGKGSALVGRAMSLYYGWWFYATVVYGSVTLLPTQPLAMGTANEFAVLANVDVVNTGETAVKGKVGVATGTSHGSDPLEVDPPEFWLADDAAESDTALSLASAAISEASLRDVDYNLVGEKLQGKRLPPGVYLIDDAAFTGSVEIDGPIIMDGLNDPSSVWIFRRAGPLAFSASDGVLQFIYENGASPDNVYWICTTAYVAPSVAVRGTILASSSSAAAIDLDSDSVVQGRVVATSGSIQLNNNTIFSNSSGGQVVWTQKSNPVGAANDEAVSVATNGTHLFILGFVNGTGSGVDSQWRLEKRAIADGALDTTFNGTGSITWNPGSGNDIPRRVLVDGSGIYVFGSQDMGSGVYQWRFEKRSLSSGAADATFGPAVVTAMLNGGLAGDMALDGSTVFLTGEMVDDLSLTTRRIRLERRSASTGDLDTTATGFFTPDTWDDGFGAGPYTSPPPDPIRPPEYPATSVGVIVDYSLYSRGARCITVVPSPSAPDPSEPFLIVGGWQDYFGLLTMALYQKRFLDDGSLDVGDGTLVPPYPGYDATDADGTVLIAWGTAPGAKQTIESIGNDGVHSFALMSIDYSSGFYPYFTPIAGKFYWAVEKRTMVPHPPGLDPGIDPAISGGQLIGDPHYPLGIYGPVPFADYELDFSCSSLVVDSPSKRFLIAGCNTGTLGGELWRIEKRKNKTIVLDALFNSSGDRPGMIENDPEPGQVEVLPQWYVYDYVTYTTYWTTIDPATDPARYYWYGMYGDPSYYRPGSPAIPGRPDRCRGITFYLDKIYVVGSDSSDTPDHLGEWRIECRNK